MKPKLLIVLLILLTITFSGCVEKELSTTTYICQEYGELYLHSDGTFHVNSLQSGASNGNYTVIRDVMFLDYGSSGFSSMLIQNGTEYIDKDGDHWSLQTI